MNLLSPPRPAPPAATGLGGTPASTTPLLPLQAASEATVAAPAPADAVACLHAFAAAWSWSLGVAALLALVQTRLDAYRVSLAWRRGTGLCLMAWSDVVPLDEGVGVNELEAACNEARHWSEAGAWPLCSAQGIAEANMPAHLSLFRAQGLTAVMSVALRNERGQVVGVLSCERIPLGAGDAKHEVGGRPTRAFAESERLWLQQLAGLIGPVMAMRRVLSQPWYLSSWSWMEALGQRLSDPRERWLRWSVLAMFGAAAFMAGWPLPYTLAVPARLEPQAQTAVVAPVDAVVLSSHVNVGDMVQAGQQLARLLPLPSLQQGDARDVAAVLAVRSPFDGVVMRQALGGGAGSRVQRGDALWLVSPGLDWRVVLEVGESDVAAIKPGQRATLRLAGETGRSVPLVLKRVVPAAVADDASVHFDVDAQAAGSGLAGWRPGMRGVAHIDMPARPVLWRAVDRLRAWWWVAIWGLW